MSREFQVGDRVRTIIASALLGNKLGTVTRTGSNHIEGSIHVRLDDRLSDYAFHPHELGLVTPAETPAMKFTPDGIPVDHAPTA